MLLLPLLLLLAAADDPSEGLPQELKTITNVYAAVEEEAADPVPPDIAIYQGAIPGMLRTLDPHSIFFDPQQYDQLKQMQKSESKGFGTIVSVLPGRVIVLEALPGTPSAKAGLAAGDEILAINNIPLARLEMEQLTQLLTEARQRQALLDVRRPGNVRLFRMTLTPELVDSPSVDRAFPLAPGIGYMRIKSFDAPTGKLVKQTIETLGGEKLKGLVIDLRDDPGGSVEAAVETASLFLQPDQLIFSIKGRTAKTEDVRVAKLVRPYTFPVSVLIDGRTASASEIVTGALQDHDRASVFGTPSYGKGLVQNVYPLSMNSAVALTIAYYYTPSGRSIQKPLQGGTLEAVTHTTQGSFHTDAGREVQGGGGIQPDEIIYPEPMDRLSMVLDASGSITTFASEYVQSHPVKQDFEATPAVLDQLQVFLSERNIRPGVSDWSSHRPWIQSRLRQEILTLAYGVSKGDEVGMQRDPVVQRAVKKLLEAPK
ncbi:MAG: S41 family peptidase [Bryobacteraceae bacterium]|jgi:carboxyl-terminal processing protease